MQKGNVIFHKFMEWARTNDNIRVAILTSSRVRKDASIDFLSDHDIELYVTDLEQFSQDDSWIEAFGEIMVRWPHVPGNTWDEEGWITRLVLFKNGERIDFQISNSKEIHVKNYRNGFQVLLDKDQLTHGIPEATYDEFIITKPTAEKYTQVVSDFWWNMYYVAKYLWRDELPFAKFMLDSQLRYNQIHTVINWYIGLHNNWSVEVGALGKKYKKLLPASLWEEFENSYVGGGVEENWNALFQVIHLFRKVAREVGAHLEYEYPHEMEKDMIAFVEGIKATPKE